MCDGKWLVGSPHANAWWSGWIDCVSRACEPVEPDMHLVVHLIEITGTNVRRITDSRLMLRFDRQAERIVWDQGNMQLFSVATHNGSRMPDVHKEPDKILKALTSHSLRSGRAMTLMFLPDEFLCRGQVEFVDAKFLSVEVHDRMQAS